MKGRYKRKCAWALGVQLLVLHSLVHSPFGSSGKPQIPWLSYLSASWGVGLSPYRKVFFICSSICVQAYLVHSELVHFSCLWVSWVTCHPASIRPSTREARTTALQEQRSTCRINCNLNEPTKFTQHPQKESHFLVSLGGLEKVAYSQRSGLAAKGCGSLWLPLKVLILWFDKADRYIFPGWKHLYACKRVCWWQLNGSSTHCEWDGVNTSPVVS